MTTGATQPPSHPEWVESVYERLAADSDGRVCKAIADEACREVPGNFLRMLVANAASQVADSLASAKTTLPWLLLQLGAPGWMASLLVPIRESGSMLPQLLIGAAVRKLPLRKWVWVACALVQSACLALLALVALQLQGAPAGWAVLALLVVFSLARAGCSIAYKDVQGKTIPKTRRGRLSGWIAAVSGGCAMLAGLAMGALPNDAPALAFVALLALGAGGWALAAWIFAGIREFDGATEGGVSGAALALQQLTLLRDDAPFRLFVLSRALAMGSSLAAPFYVALARDALGQAVALLGLFIAIEGLAGLISSPIWGRMADRSSRQVFAWAGAGAGVLSIAVAAWSWWGPGGAAATWFFPLAFLGLGICHAGVRLGRKTYLLDLAEGDRRTAYVAVSNTVIGVLLLASGAVGALASSYSVAATVLVLGCAGLLGAALSLRWPEVSG
jgi:MFS family permease